MATRGMHIRRTPGITKRTPQASSEDQSHHFANSRTWMSQIDRNSQASALISARLANFLHPSAPSINGGENKMTLFPADNKIPYRPTSQGFENPSSE